jgi:cell division protein FtsB
MAHRLVPLLLLVLLAVVHVQIWWGRGSITDVAELRLNLAEQQAANDQARLRNTQLSSEVRDLQDGLEMVEELARYELGMVKPNEIFVQVVPGN